MHHFPSMWLTLFMLCKYNSVSFQFRTFFFISSLVSISHRERRREIENEHIRNEEKKYCIFNANKIKGMPYVTAQCKEIICCTAHFNRFILYREKYNQNIIHINWEFHRIQYVHAEATHSEIQAKKLRGGKKMKAKWRDIEIERRIIRIRSIIINETGKLFCNAEKKIQ